MYQWEKSHDVDVAVARLPKGSDPAELAQKDPEALREAIANAVPFLQFRLERVLDAANIATAEGRARAAEQALSVIAEHPSDLVRDQYLLMVADRLRLDVITLRPRVEAKVRGVANAPVVVVSSQPRRRDDLPRPGQEALRLRLFFPDSVSDRLIAPYFVHDVQRLVFDGLASGKAVSQVIDDLTATGEHDAAAVLSELSVGELDRDYTTEDVSAVVSQLLRAAVAAALKDIERDLRAQTIDPLVAMATIRDVKQRLDLLSGPRGSRSEEELRDWLLSRQSAATPE